MVKSKTYKELFFKTIKLSILMDLFFCAIHNIIDNDNSYIYLLYLQIILSIMLGIYISKNNKEILIEKDICNNKKEYKLIGSSVSILITEKKKYQLISLLISLLIVLIFMLFPDIIAIPYTSIQTFIYETTGIHSLGTLLDFYSIAICITIVFFRYSFIFNKK